MNMNWRLVLAIGLILLASGIIVTVLTLTKTLPNSQNYSYSSVLTSTQFQSKEYLVFEEVFDTGDKIHLTVKASAPSEEGWFENGPYRIVRYILDIYISDEANTTLLQKELDTRTASDSYPPSGDYSLEYWLQISVYNRYKVLVTYKPWMEMGSTGNWHVADYGPNFPMEASLNANLDVEKEAISPVFLTLGLTILVTGTALIIWPLARRSRRNERAPPEDSGKNNARISGH